MSKNQSNSSRPGHSESLSLRTWMSRDLQLRGIALRTHDGYLREVRKLAACYHTPPTNSPNNNSR